ncbi:DNA replication/repair protein RecF [Legionella pneumophila]|uniref:DNA replication and repair protein RecF n=1 Tax=Legionella pneumophila subsp. pascullei TaxID=91890 RepID=A0AAX2IRD1_LEGPN|nr:DNA replication/repair protein RecF [Legionella pneumophila]AMP88174.1 DNA replication/repair protein RecF [Legionella pneumophila subsp. pascullei]AMP91082.1 DNA polymerase [Legionella pneumophila subsp. pascullei]AMP94069.1 DNA polymerase [Legionella pneumophila subsp. pascullei]SQG88840.1 DNA recombination and repair protein ATPase RecF [Legionella pneumophila subsp. pascullei]VEH03890.1 DNA recombination and repair protein ATPase RecF [Legionella pneumophila subsp. pascullei]
MILSEVRIHNFRNISSTNLILNSHFNCITGPNGSGKTSLLEALYMLSCGHSFRSREVAPIISYGQNQLNVFARAHDESTISVQKSLTDGIQIKLNNHFCCTTSQLAYALPCQVIYSDIFQIIDAGPSVRRSLLDWGLFHVKHDYLKIWKEYKRTLSQRNALLKSRATFEHFIPWDQQLCQLANQLDKFRNDYFLQWQPKFYQVLSELTNISCTIYYYKGWDRKNTGQSLNELLLKSFENDRNRLYTQLGAHQADLIITADQHRVKHTLSRGQQKIILISLKLAQGQLLDKDCLYLIDDLAAELDEYHQKNLIKYLTQQRGQFVITNLNNNNLHTLPTDTSLLQVNCGEINIL